MASRNRRISLLASNLDANGGILQGAIAPSVDLGSGVTIYDSAGLLPDGASAGRQAFVTSNQNLYIHNGSGWYSSALINATPVITSVVDSDGGVTPFDLAINGTTITITATDSDGDTITYSAELDSNFNEFATITNNGNEFTITPLDGVDASQSGTIVFKATDGVNIGQSAPQLFNGPLLPPTAVDVLVVAGGGAGGGGAFDGKAGGGGGGGGLLTASNFAINQLSYSIIIGDGGVWSASYSHTSQQNGQTSSAFGLTAVGGGTGADFQSAGSANAGADGGSGGGGSGMYNPRVATAGGLGQVGQGNNGAAGQAWRAGTGYRGGGGGGASTSGSLLNGGDGSQWLDGNYYAGGGGAGFLAEGGSYIGQGGLGGGGDGKSTNPETTGQSGTLNTGGGGGAGHSGGSGIVVIRYPANAADPSYSANHQIVQSGSYKFLYMKETGTLTF